MTLVDLFQQASAETQRLVLEVLEQEVADRAWSAQVGPALTQADTARLLGKSEQATAKDRRLLRVRTRSGRIAYPVVQFRGRGILPGIGDVLAVLASVADPVTVAAWLTGVHPALDSRRPVDVLRDGDVAQVLAAARRFARQAA